ncbi:hypothetical protein [Pseudomonas putida]|uniref:hypothetical protein n=1 Tax=Pseudomonas putida TaxID=303 RepID=UPI0008192F70|nr:hypothetical protein [Pseudomonas putida]OCT24838.1 hypothetical protein A6E24_12975 [Pseudomonas putida]OCT28827.1 hypothetical protein A6E23_04140 [Pseudomonas putida]OCT34944.1 hypothetical protein A6E20_20320 [Pseudomonas putida]
MDFDVNVILTGIVSPVVLILVKALLDVRLGHKFVKYLWWLPVRWLFREKPINISGVWEQQWEGAGSNNFSRDIDRHSYTTIRQLGRFCYAEFYSKSVEYCFFGEIKASYLVGDWYDKNDMYSYFGAFQLRIIDSKSMQGKFLGHSKSTSQVLVDEWNWSR